MDIDILTGTSDVEREYLEDYLFYTIANDEKRRAVSSRLFEIYHGLDGILCRSYEELEAVSGSQSAVSLKLLACVSSRRFTDKVVKGRRLGEWLGEYFAWHFFGISNETVCLALFDKNDKLINITKLSEGTVNASEIVPRKAMEAAARASAKSAVLAHNHPGGISVSSRNDELVTTIIKAALANVGTELVCHLIVAGHDVGVVSIPVEKS
jgi:DNA repair protein RadC